MDSIFLKKFVTKYVVLGVALSQMVTVQATPESEGFEMAASFVSIPVKIAARHCAYKNNVKAAALLNVTADTLNICRDVLYFWNQSLEADRHYIRAAFIDGGVYAAVNGAMTIRDLVKWSQHLGECMGFKRAVPAPDDDDFIDFDDDVSEVVATEPVDAAADEEKIGRLAYAWQVVTLPTLEGLTAFAVAFSQQSGLDWETSPAFRRMATAAHSFVRLLDEKAMLKSDSPRKEKALYALLMANAIWLAYEIYIFSNRPRPLSATPAWHQDAVVVDPAPATVVATDVKPAAEVAHKAPVPLPVARVHENPINCRMCELMGEADPKLTNQNRVELSCGHVYCRNCFLAQVNAARNDKESKTAMAAIRCPAGEGRARCQHRINGDDLLVIIAHENAEQQRAIFNAWVAAADEQALLTMGLKHCPMPDCTGQFEVVGNIPVRHACDGTRNGRPCGEQYWYCPRCNGQHSDKVRCEDYKAPESKDAAERLSQAWLATQTRPCPQCHRRIQKSDPANKDPKNLDNGCNHITCDRQHGGCGYQFCWLCGEDCSDAWSHYASGRCANKHFTQDEDKGVVAAWAQRIEEKAAVKQPQTDNKRAARH